jgi:hypothetical protein
VTHKNNSHKTQVSFAQTNKPSWNQKLPTLNEISPGDIITITIFKDLVSEEPELLATKQFTSDVFISTEQSWHLLDCVDF